MRGVATEKGYKKLIVWNKADKLVMGVYLKTRSFPREEIFGITSQLRRAAVSVPTNIVEGCGRQSSKDLRRFCSIALGSLNEVEYLLDLSSNLKYLKKDDYVALQSLRKEVGNLLWKFHQSL